MMDALREDLQSKLTHNPANVTLRSAINALDDLQVVIKSGKLDASTQITKQNLLVLLQDLRSQGILGQTEDEIGHLSVVIDYLISSMAKDDDEQEHGEDALERGQLSFAVVPRRATLVDLAPWNTRPHSIPYELVTELNEVYFLHLLTTAPEKVLPPGKSLRSVLTSRSSETNGSKVTKDDHNLSRLHSIVQEMARRAFWDEALRALQDPLPSTQIARLERLYADLAAALHSVLPEENPSMIHLHSPLPPTTSPLETALYHLHELLHTLRKRCAPVRDAALDGLISLVEDTSIPPARRVIGTIKDLLQLAELLKEDMSTAAVNLVSDESLSNEIARIARERERAAVWRVWGGIIIQRTWKAWMDEIPSQEIQWIRRLMNSLAADLPVSCNLPVHGQSSETSSSSSPAVLENTIPPIFIFSVLQLIRIQNELQVIVIAACLCTLLPRQRHNPPSPMLAVSATGGSTSIDDTQSQTFLERIISLLMLEVDPTDPEFGTTKLINLGDEVLHEIRRLQQPGQEINEKAVRASVDRVLRPNDPVFVLLRQRLLESLANRLSSLYIEMGQRRLAPPVVRAGRTHEQRAILSALGSQGGFRIVSAEEVGSISVLGFDDPVLKKAVTDIACELGTIIEWIRSVWGKSGLEGIS